MRKNCFNSDQEKRLKLEAESREFAKYLRSLEQFIQTANAFLTCSCRFLISNELERLLFKLEKNIGI